MLASIPSPPNSDMVLGPLTLHYYGMLITIGAIVAVQISEHRWVARGGTKGDMTSIAIWAVPGGLVGARIYHVITDPELFYGHWGNVFAIWQGGLGIPGGIVGGVGVGVLIARRKGLPVARLLDIVAPAMPVAQGIGRLGNWFNQELYGRPSTLPWALRIDPAHRELRYVRFATFQPTFLYELLWDLALAAVLVWVVERRVRLRPGRLFAVYIGGYAFGRFWVELLRSDYAHRFFGLRINDWLSLAAILGAAVVLWTSWRTDPARTGGATPAVDDPAGGMDASDAAEASDGSDASNATEAAPPQLTDPPG